MIIKFVHNILVFIYFCQLVDVSSLSIPTSVIANITVVPHTWHPTLFLAFAVNATELQLYIDPQFIIAEPIGNDTGYILFALSNTTVPFQPAFADLEVATNVMYNSTLQKSSFHLRFNNLLPAAAGQIYTPVPYGYAYSSDMRIILNEANYTYQFLINDGEIQLNTSIKWNPNEQLNVTMTENNLASSLLNPMINFKYVQSLYKYGDPKPSSFPILHGEQRSYSYDEPLYSCTIDYFNSTLIEKVLGSISSLSTSPDFCAFTLQRSANVTSISQIDLQNKGD